MSQTVKLIQFMHPGKEHTLSKTAFKKGQTIFNWNDKDHKRKFMKVTGEYIDGNDMLQKSDELYFWGEWEPMSYISQLPQTNLIGAYPTCLHKPFLDLSNYKPSHNNNCSSSNCHLQNTDPFVFADHFFYSLCQQDHKPVMRTLPAGSLILFGSIKNPRSNGAEYFALDTVFVVGDNKPFTPATYQTDLGNFIPQDYDKIMGFVGSTDNLPKTAYQGVNYSERDQYLGMYSFVPCKIGKNGQNGFERIHLTRNDIIELNEKLSQGLKTSNLSLQRNKAIWDTLCVILDKQGYSRGVRMFY